MLFSSLLQALGITNDLLTMFEDQIRAGSMIGVACEYLKLVVKGIKW